MELFIAIFSALVGGGAVWLLLRGRLTEVGGQLLAKEQEAGKLNSELVELRMEKAASDATAAARAQAAEERLQERESLMAKYVQELNGMRAAMQVEFKVAASQILTENSTKLSEFNKTQVETLLTPLKTQLGDFRTRIDTIHQTDSTDRATLKAQLEQLGKLNQKITDEANALTNALKGNSQVRGAWGELVLERLLETAGLRKNEEFLTQSSVTTDDGSRLRPDVILRIPDNRHLVIDSKCSLVAYEQAVNAGTEAERASAVAAHVKAVRKHVEELSGKSYEDTGKLFTPDFVLMFVPLEPAFTMAVSLEQDLYDWALAKKVILCTAPTLLVTLKTAAMLWKQDRQSKNLLEIVTRGGALYDKFEGLYRDLLKVGDCLKRTQGCYDEAVGKLKDGRGNLLWQVEELKQLGAKAQKSLPAAELLPE